MLSFLVQILIATIYFCMPEFTGLVPKVQSQDVKSGLAAALFQKIVSEEGATEALLKCVVFQLPYTKKAKLFDASGVDLIWVLSKTSDYSLIQRLLEFKMTVKHSQIISAMLLIPPEDAKTFDLLLKHRQIKQNILDASCKKAITALKVELVSLLIEHGATPPADELVSNAWFCDNLVVQKYLEKEGAQKHTEKPCNEKQDLGTCKVGLI